MIYFLNLNITNKLKRSQNNHFFELLKFKNLKINFFIIKLIIIINDIVNLIC